MRPSTEVTHYRIYVYDNGHPLTGDPTPVALCPWPGRPPGPTVENVSQVTCPTCLRHISELGLP